MIARANTQALAQRSKTRVGPLGGTGPYSYAVVEVGGGTVTPEGLYTAPQKYGIFTVRITDSLGATADVKIGVMDAVKLLCDVIAKELNLASDQIIIWNQKFPVLQDKNKLYIAARVLTAKPMTNIRKTAPDGSSIQALNIRTIVSLDLMSFNVDARDRKEEVVMALASVYAENQQVANSFSIGKIPAQFVDLTVEEGSGIPYRFNTTVSLQHSFVKSKETPYYDNFEDTEIKIEGNE